MSYERDHLNDFISEWAPLIRNNAVSLARNLPPHIDHFKDLYAYGTWGLIDAIHKYDPKKGDFHVYANSRVKGKMRDYIKNEGPIDSHFLKMAKEINKQIMAAQPQTSEPQMPSTPALSPPSQSPSSDTRLAETQAKLDALTKPSTSPQKTSSS